MDFCCCTNGWKMVSIPEEQRICSKCGTKMVPMGKEKDGAADTIAGQCVLKINKLFEIEDNLRDCSPAERQKQPKLTDLMYSNILSLS